MAVQSKAKIRESLMEQLRSKGADVAHFKALIDDYITYFDMVKAMKKAIKQKGVTYTSISAQGKEYEKDNPAVKMLPRYTSAMLSILRELGLTTDNVEEEDEEL